MYYLERDILGQCSNAWIKYCELIGQTGPLDSQSKKLAKMCQLAVDFGKRGKCVKKSDFEDLNNIIKKIENS